MNDTMLPLLGVASVRICGDTHLRAAPLAEGAVHPPLDPAARIT